MIPDEHVRMDDDLSWADTLRFFSEAAYRIAFCEGAKAMAAKMGTEMSEAEVDDLFLGMRSIPVEWREASPNATLAARFPERELDILSIPLSAYRGLAETKTFGVFT